MRLRKLLGLSLAAVATVSVASASTSAAAAGAVPTPDHVVIVLFENHQQPQVIGSPSAPYITSLSKAGANFTQSYGVTHPSQPNYLAQFSGSTQGVSDDSCPHSFTTNNLGKQLIDAGRTFAGYSEGLPSTGYTGCTSGKYARKHAPWANFANLATSTNKAYTAFPTNYATLPTVSYVIPDLCNDMHDCSVATGDTWLKNNLKGYADWALTHNSLLVVDFDEDDFTTANRIPTVFYGQPVKPGSYSEKITHYSVLRTIEDMYALSHLGSAASATSITDTWL
ncbi:MAG: phosphatidylinositol-3-phosphatase [Actinomycetota bacterium]|jgi:hypothetical protein|nr:phosphatidylinositol-3-phosphatase [Actinomycetota bacterium]